MSEYVSRSEKTPPLVPLSDAAGAQCSFFSRDPTKGGNKDSLFLKQGRRGTKRLWAVSDTDTTIDTQWHVADNIFLIRSAIHMNEDHYSMAWQRQTTI